jgi:hypothetical protein
MRARFLIACVFAAALAGCSETALRRDSLSYVEIGGREIVVSWVEIPPDLIDLRVEAAAAPDSAPLDRATAIDAAGRVAAGRCLFDRVHAVFPPVEYAGGSFAFRYACGGSVPPPPPPGYEEED